MAYAEATKVPVAKTKAEIEKLVTERYKATAFGIMTKAHTAQVAFQLQDRNILFFVNLPEDSEQKLRSRWRALLLVIKAKLESVEAGIETIEEAFLANIVMPDGRTVGQHTLPAIAEHYAGGDVPLLPPP